MTPPRFQGFANAAQTLGVSLGERELELFRLYDESLRFWNTKMNLVSRHEEAELPMKHFLDALSPVPLLPHRELHLLDIGTGAGLPGIPMKIAVDAWRLSLLEASRKKTSFLNYIVRHLALDQVTVIHDRVEAMIRQGLGQGAFDVVISRAAFKLQQLVEAASFFLRPGGTLVAMKGNIPESEWDESVQVSDKLGLFIKEAHAVTLPATNMARKIIIYTKT